jgi:hypothetical protein
MRSLLLVESSDLRPSNLPFGQECVVYGLDFQGRKYILVLARPVLKILKGHE